MSHFSRLAILIKRYEAIDYMVPIRSLHQHYLDGAFTSISLRFLYVIRDSWASVESLTAIGQVLA